MPTQQVSRIKARILNVHEAPQRDMSGQLRFLLTISKITTQSNPLALSLSKCRAEERAGNDRLSPNGVWCRDLCKAQ